ncbi:MAG: tetratricopeptide repeat protein [Ignavibacteria bacterium]|nr:tetratricopeptide repeat protein [Ignavibacteria bacterium]
MRNIRIILLAVCLAGNVFPSAAQVASPKEQQDYSFALGLFKDAQYRLAFDQFVDFLKNYPESNSAIDAEYYSAECLYQQEYFTDARARFRSLREKHPRSSLADDAAFREGEAAFRQGKADEAQALFEGVVREYPDGDMAHEAAYWAGESAFKRDDFANAQRFYGISYEHYPQGRIRDYALFSLGYLQEKQGKFAQARETYDGVLKEFPRSALSPTVQTRIAACYYQEKAYTETLARLDGLADSPDPDNAAERLYYRIEAQYQLGRYQEAEQLATSFLSAYPRHARARAVRYTLGWSSLELKKYTEAVAAFDSLSSGSDALAQAAQYRKGMVLRLAGKREAAAAALERVAASGSGGEYADNAQFELGMIAFEEEAYGEALKRFERIPLSYPNSDVLGDAWFLAAETKMLLGKPAEAVAMYQAAAATPSTPPGVLRSALFRLGSACFESRQFARASEAFAAYAARFPDDARAPEALVWQGEAAFQAGKFSDAAGAYARAGSAAKDTTTRYNALYGEGWSLFKLGRYAASEKIFRRLTEEHKGTREDMDANVRLGDALFAQKKFAEAIKAYRYAARMYPKHHLAPYALLQLGNAEHRSGDTPSGMITLRSLLARHADSEFADEAQYSLAWLHFQSKEYGLAAAEYRKLGLTWPQSPLAPNARYGIADCLYNEGRYADAQKAYQDVIDAFPDSPVVSDALDGISQCMAMQGRKDEASAVRDRWLAAHPQSRAADAVDFSLLKKAAAESGPKTAIPQARAFLAKHPDGPRTADARLLLAQSYRAEKHYDSARAALAPLAGGPLAAEARLEQAGIAMDEQNPPEAVAIYTDMLLRGDASRPQAELLYLRGRAYATDANVVEAREDFLHASEIGGDDTHAALSVIELGRLEARAGRVDSALALLTALATSRTDDVGAEAQYRIGDILADANRNADAEKALLRVRYSFASSASWAAQSMLRLGSLYERQGNRAKAKETYTALVARYDGSEAATEAKTRLERLQ